MTATRMDALPTATDSERYAGGAAAWAIFPCHSPVEGSCSCRNPDCDSPAKHPRTKHGLSDATTDKDQQERWWKQWPNANIGVATGPSGLVVIDIDKGDVDGFDTLLEIEQKYGRFPETISARTGSGGLHLYFRAPTDRKIASKNGWLPGIDVKATGGYVLAPPSVNMNGPYSWEPGCGPSEIEIAEIPAWLLDLLPKKSSAPPPTINDNGHASLLQRAQQYAAKAAGASEGTRNSAAFNLAGHVAAIVDEYGGRLAESEILSIMEGWNARCNPPLSNSELVSCVKSALHNGTAREAKRPVERVTRQIDPPPPPPPCEKYTFAELRRQFPTLRPPVIHGVGRQGETANVISNSKIGKTCLVHGMVLCQLTRRRWLDCFETTGGQVLILDNELHRELLVQRIRSVAEAMGIAPEEYENDLVIWPLRGKLRSLHDLATELTGVKPGEFSLILWDSKYRFASPGTSENSNSDETLVYNTIDEIGERTNAFQVLVHHASKGGQADKRVTDVGSGAGAMSRACDTHLVLREHEDDGLVVLDAAVRSFAPVEPLVLRWQFPLWLPETSADPARLRRAPTRGDQRQANDDRRGIEEIIAALRDKPGTARELRKRVAMGPGRLERLLAIMLRDGHVTTETTTIRGNQTDEYHLSK